MASAVGDAAALCTCCQSFVKSFFTQHRSSTTFKFKFSHGTREERQRTASSGCACCALSLQVADANRDFDFEFYEPGKFAAANDDTLEPTAAAGYEAHTYRNVHDLQNDVPPGRTDNPACFELVRRWMDSCRLRHPNCSRPMRSTLPTRVIDVGADPLRDDGVGALEPFLFESRGQLDRYVALSHRWEANLSFKTTLANLDEHKQCIPLSTLPNTFQDAVVVCRAVGIQYLWIDAICIVQDSPEDWGKEASRMAAIYRDAVFTISALDSASSNGGLFRQRRLLPSVTFPSPLEGQDASGKPPVLGMRVAAPRFDQEIEASPLNSRGWIYQERTISTATLHYGGHQMMWECRTKVASEHDSEIQQFSQALTYNIGRIFWLTTNNSNLRPGAWEDIVNVYTRKRFTVPSDRLPAIMGVAQLFSDIMGRSNSSSNPLIPAITYECTFLAGLWSANLHRQLLWGYDGSDGPNILGPPKLNLVWVPPSWKPRLPSWSWISVDYPVGSWVGVEAQDLHWDFKVIDASRACLLANLAAYRSGKASLELDLFGRVAQLEIPAMRITSQQPVRSTVRAKQRHEPYTLHITIDPGCAVSHATYGFKVATYRGGAGYLAPKQSYFLLLEQVERRCNRFKRIGVGSGSVSDVDLAFGEGSDTGLTLV